MNELSKEIKKEIERLGADIVGIADITEVPTEIRKDMPYGISIAVAIDPMIINEIAEGPTENYYKAYMSLNNKLDMIVSSGAEFLHKKGYEAIAQTGATVAANETEYNSLLPHKTIATRAGIGWIGKCALLVTDKYGSAIRISAILTKAPLEADTPINESNCGNCRLCTDSCPGEAITGANWNIHSNREDIFDPVKCRRTARRLSKELLNKEITLCARCVYVCPYTQKYLQKG